MGCHGGAHRMTRVHMRVGRREGREGRRKDGISGNRMKGCKEWENKGWNEIQEEWRESGEVRKLKKKH